MKCAQRKMSFRRLVLFENGNTIGTGRKIFIKEE
jgi:hypothetical protein